MAVFFLWALVLSNLDGTRNFLPHWFAGDSAVGKWVARRFGDQAVTIWVQTFMSVPIAAVDPTYFDHERQHTVQWLRWGCVGALLMGPFGMWWLVLLAFFTFFLVRYFSEFFIDALYAVSMQDMTWAGACKYAYDKNSLEQESRRVSGQPER